MEAPDIAQETWHTRPMAPDTWRCECGYTNLASKVCTICRRPRTAISPSDDEEKRGFAPPPPAEPKKRRPAR